MEVLTGHPVPVDVMVSRWRTISTHFALRNCGDADTGEVVRVQLPGISEEKDCDNFSSISSMCPPSLDR
jgi:hypothetical protein